MSYVSIKPHFNSHLWGMLKSYSNIWHRSLQPDCFAENHATRSWMVLVQPPDLKAWHGAVPALANTAGGAPCSSPGNSYCYTKSPGDLHQKPTKPICSSLVVEAYLNLYLPGEDLTSWLTQTKHKTVGLRLKTPKALAPQQPKFPTVRVGGHWNRLPREEVKSPYFDWTKAQVAWPGFEIGCVTSKGWTRRPPELLSNLNSILFQES